MARCAIQNRSKAATLTADAAATDDLRRAQHLMTATAVREQCARVFARIESGESPHFAFHPQALAPIADRVATLTRERFPDLEVPLHARWRHFETGGIDRFGALAAARNWTSEAEAARAMGDLAIVSVLLDAGAGPTWRFTEHATGTVAGRSEGLALAAFSMFASGAFSAVPADPLRADADGLQSLTAKEFEAGFQIGADNPIAGADGRRALLGGLADAIRTAPDLFALEDGPRPGGLIDSLAADATDNALPASAILAAVLEGLSPIWPSRLTLAGQPMGDVWLHPDLPDTGPGGRYVPFHKLSTWLSLSLIEPLAVRGITVTDLDALPGLAEYRNGGLFVDGGALTPREPTAGPHTVDSPLIVEWRAATVALLSRLAPMVRERLGADLPLAAILEGGTWLAGRQLAAETRADGGPPIAIISDGTVF